MRKFSKKGKAAVLHNLRAAIAERFGSQLECARAVRIHAVRLNRILNGWTQPKAEEKERLAAALDAHAEWLFACVRVPPPAVRAPSPEVAAV